MKRLSVMLDGYGKISVDEQEVPKITDNDVLVEVHASLISPGTEMGDVKCFRDKPDPNFKKIPFGYSNAGIVLEAGKNCKRLKKGMRIASMGNKYAQHSSHNIAAQNMCVPIPDNVSFEDATFACLGATALQSIRRAELEFGENVLVAGLGIIGNFAGQLARYSGCHVIGMDLFELRKELSMKTGFDKVIDPKKEDMIKACAEFTKGRGIDCAFICLGGDGTELLKNIYKTISIAPDTHRWGRIVIPGGVQITTTFAAALGNVDLRSSARTGPGYFDPAYEQGADYPAVFVPWDTQRNLEEIVRGIAEKKLSVNPMISHRFPLAKAADACDLLIEHPDQSLGVILQPR
ncbi:MAG: hypothetical protein A2252_06845 [Elusimicrobia bacterium RIFOXYA2_FULL_39_19]|nr:MAG: hypothetical protein A2252_06845 [Elusimicrobia bacterium RIFOXYA2_FULL_39_19]